MSDVAFLRAVIGLCINVLLSRDSQLADEILDYCKEHLHEILTEETNGH